MVSLTMCGLHYNHIEFIQNYSLGQDGMPARPTFTVAMKSGKNAGGKNAISRDIQKQASKQDIRDDDMFQRFFGSSRPT
jgi:hypothetical protein